MEQKSDGTIADKTYKIYIKFLSWKSDIKIRLPHQCRRSFWVCPFGHSCWWRADRGSWLRPWILRLRRRVDDDRVVTSFNDHFGVFSIFGDGGLWLWNGRSRFTAARKMILLPSLIPPRTPPAWLVSLVILPSFVWKESLLILPFVSAALKPSPISKPFDCSDGQHCFGKIGVQFFQIRYHRFLPAYR